MIAIREGGPGGRIEPTGEGLADILASAHGLAELATLSEADIPDDVNGLMVGNE